MDIRQFRYYLSAMRLGSLVSAAQENFVTQPAITLQLKKLERELGERLYERRGKTVVPTEVGELLLAEAREIVARVDALPAAVQAVRDGERGRLRMGSIDAASVYLLPEVFAGFRKKYPGVELDIHVDDTDTLLHEVDGGSIDLAIVTLPVSTATYAVTPLYDDELVLVCHPRHELAAISGRRALELAANRSLISYPLTSNTRRLIERVFLDHGTRLRVSMEMSSPEAIRKLTESGLGASILPRRSVESSLRQGALVHVKTGRVRFHRVLGVVYPINRSPGVVGDRFLAELYSRFSKRPPKGVAKR